jgi:hypothetical protein
MTKTNIQHDRVFDFLYAIAVIDSFGVENERSDTKIFGPRYIVNAVLSRVNRVVENTI